jgi:hypothetical protein
MKKQRKTEAGLPPELQKLHDSIGNYTVPEPSAKMDEGFRIMLEEEKKSVLIRDKFQRKAFLHIVPAVYFRAAAGIALFLLGWFGAALLGTGSKNNAQIADLGSEVKRLRETLVLSMMEQNSPVERIKAVDMISKMNTADDKIIVNLLTTLENDDNDNVRLLALETLIKYAGKPEVREGLIHAISMQSSPMVQIRLAEIMVSLQEKRSVPEFRKVLNNAQLNYSVRTKIDEAVQTLI